jgi:hypothetical protein
MALIDIAKLSAELDKMIAVQEAEIKQIDAEIAANNEAKWKSLSEDLVACFEVFRKTGADNIYIPLFVYRGTVLELCFSSYGRVMIYYNRRNSISSNLRPQRSFEFNVTRSDNNKFHITELNNRWPEIRDRFMSDFESACVVALKQKAEAANAKYQAALERQKGAQT